MAIREERWGEWAIVGKSRGYSSPVFVTDHQQAVHCFVKVGDELRRARYHPRHWEDFAPVDGGRLRSDPVAIFSPDTEEVEVYGTGLEGQLARNVWSIGSSSWHGWQDLGRPAGGILGAPAVEQYVNHRYVVVRGGDNRLYLRRSEGHGATWEEWEQSERLQEGQFTADASTFTVVERGRPEIVLVGRSLENELASISMKIASIADSDESIWGEWGVIENSRGYSSPVFAKDTLRGEVHCFAKFGDELRHARYRDGRWEGFASVGGGRFRSDPVVNVGRSNGRVEVFGAGLEGQLARNVLDVASSSWKGWEDLGRPAAGIVDSPAVQVFEFWEDFHFVFVKGGDNRLYLCHASDDGESWADWEQGERLRQGQLRGEVSTLVTSGGSRLDLVVFGRSLENELASIPLEIFDFGASSSSAGT